MNPQPQPHRQLQVPARYYMHVCTMLMQRRVDIAPLLLDAKIPLELLSQPESSIGIPQIEAFIASVLKKVSRSQTALDLGQSLKLSSHGILGYGLLSSPNFSYATKLISRYFSLIMPMFEIQHRHRHQKIEIDIIPLQNMSPDCMDFHLEAIAVAWHCQARELLSEQLPVYDIDLSVIENAAHKSFRQLEGVRFHFGWQPEHTAISSGIRISYPESIGPRGLNLADPSALVMAERRCSELLQETSNKGGIENWVKLLMQESKDDFPTQQELASMLNISSKTLSRVLQKNGISYRQLRNDIRHRRACEALKNPQRSVLEIALELGYSDSANFSRAFKRFAQCSPAQWRARLKNQPEQP